MHKTGRQTAKKGQKEMIVIVPARNEEDALRQLLPDLLQAMGGQVVVVDNDSADRTGEVSRKAGATVIHEKRLGYGSACLAGIKYVNSLLEPPDSVCFFDGDGQCFIEDILSVASPVLSKKAFYCQGSRMVQYSSRTGMPPAARAANRFFGAVLTKLWKQPVTDLGPLRVISRDLLNELGMQSTGFGWTIEMSSKILKSGHVHLEIPVQYCPRASGESKISGNVKSSLKAAFVMVATLVRVMIFWGPKDGKNQWI